MTPSRPIEIVGGGLAGLSLGLALQRAGVAVTLHEAGSYPRHRVCGEFITGLPAATRVRLGLDPFLAGAALNHTNAWFRHDRPASSQRLPAPALGLSRHVLDARLAAAFVEAGGNLHAGDRAAELADAPGRVIATGRRRSHATWLGLKLHAVALPLAADLEFHLGDDAYVGLARIEHGRVNLCGLFRRCPLSAHGSALLLSYLRAAGLNALADRLATAGLDEDSFCAVAAVDFDHRVAPSRELRLGDACAMIPPFTGHGMAMAFQSAELALDPLLAYTRGAADWPHTRDAVHHALRRRFRLRLASAALLHPFLLRRGPQAWLAALNRTHLLPFRPIYAALH